MNTKGLNFTQLKEKVPYVIYGTFLSGMEPYIGYNIGHLIKKEKNKVLIEFLTNASLIMPPTIKDIENQKPYDFIISYQFILKKDLEYGIWKVFPIDKEIFLKVIEIHKKATLEALTPLVANMKTFTKLYSEFK